MCQNISISLKNYWLDFPVMNTGTALMPLAKLMMLLKEHSTNVQITHFITSWNSRSACLLLVSMFLLMVAQKYLRDNKGITNRFVTYLNVTSGQPLDWAPYLPVIKVLHWNLKKKTCNTFIMVQLHICHDNRLQPP